MDAVFITLMALVLLGVGWVSLLVLRSLVKSEN